MRNPIQAWCKDALQPCCSCMEHMHRAKADESAHQVVCGALRQQMTYSSEMRGLAKLNQNAQV